MLTSGEGGVFPRGIVVGEVVERGGDLRVEFGMTRWRGGFVRLMPSMKIPKPEAFPLEEDPDAAAGGDGVEGDGAEDETAASDSQTATPGGD